MLSSTRDRWLAATYAATIFVSAFLLFQVQPLVTKHILPWFGGSPAVWTVCMLFFQAMLLAGYGYAHWSQRWQPKWQVGMQLAIIATAIASVSLLSVLPDARWQPQGEGQPALHIVLMLAASVALPFFALATTAPIIQSWFARSFPSRVPYRLYALSNAGSLLALLSYPFFVERAFNLPQQARLWEWGFIVYCVLGGAVAIVIWRDRVPPRSVFDDNADVDSPPSKVQSASRVDSPTWHNCILWLLLPALATVALLATTNHVCTDVTPVPLLWVVPLALYLLTFIIAFDRPRWYRRTPLAALTLVAIYGAAVTSRTSYGWVELYDLGMTGRLIRPAVERFITSGRPRFHVDFLKYVATNLAAMFGFCLLCHGELVRQRPHPRYLTSFYLMIAAGGMLGGVAVTLIAPHVFRTYFEWQLTMYVGAILAVAVVLRQLVLGALSAEDVALHRRRTVNWPLMMLVLIFLPASLALLDLVEYLHIPDVGVRARVRSFFGTLAVREKISHDPPNAIRFLYHGAITHGSQYTDANRRGQPTSYYGAISGVGRSVNFFRRRLDLGGLRIGVVGLGTGTMAAYVGDGDSITFYEIDPEVIKLTERDGWFTYLGDCQVRGGTYEINLGDARISLQRELRSGQPRRFHVLAIDAFSGDAIPIHLLTTEAIAIYLRHLSTAVDDGVDGALVLHVSNRYLDLEPVVRGAAQQSDIPMVCLKSPSDPDHGIYEADWIVLTRNQALLATLVPFAKAAEAPARPAILWTDDRSNLLDVVK